MKLPIRLTTWLAYRLMRTAFGTAPDFIIGGGADPYLKRWYLTPWSRWVDRAAPTESLTRWQRFVSRLPGVYLHQFLRSDDDRALHDHPWANCSILLHGDYVEHSIAAGGVHRRALRNMGDVVFRRAVDAHRVELLHAYRGGVLSPRPAPCWSLFITGFRRREWGFHCPERGWVHWRTFTAASDRGAIGKGCESS